MTQKVTYHQKLLSGFHSFFNLSVWLLLSMQITAQIPQGYYDPALGLNGPELKTALRYIIDDHTVLSYSQLWTAFSDTDKKANGKVWDMYSDIPGGTPPYEYTFISDQCGNYGAEGDCYNREHSFPKSWFSDASPMYSDLFHIVPTDGFVNGKRGNDPFGEVGAPIFTSKNGSMSGLSSWPGYSGNVFEPIDEYKGDFARGYFYMVTRYEANVSSWSSPMLDGTTYPAYTPWALSLLIHWHESDPVSTKEIDRNNAIYNWQNNRNPFIDNPAYVNLIWGDQLPGLVFSSIPVTTVMVGNLYDYNITAGGGDGGTAVISCTQKPEWLSFTPGTNGTANLSGTPTEANQGPHQVILVANDGETQVQQSFLINVQVTTLELEFVSLPENSCLVNQQYIYRSEAIIGEKSESDVDYLALEIPAWLSLSKLNDGTAILYGFPDEEDLGINEVVLKAVFETYEVLQSFDIQVVQGAQGTPFTETFTLMPSDDSAYLLRSWTGDHGVQWTATNARTDQNIDGRAVCFKAITGSYLQSELISNGIISLSFQHIQKFTGSGGALALFVNDQQVGEPVSVTSEMGTAVFNGINISGDYTLKLVSNGLSRMAIDNLTWTNSIAQKKSPVFRDLLVTPANPSATEMVDFSVMAIDPDGSIVSVVLHFGNQSDNPDQQLDMTLSSENIYTGSTLLPFEAGDVYYTLEATDNEGNTSISPQFVIIPSDETSVPMVYQSHTTIYPNPFESRLSLSEGSKITSITFYDILGQAHLSIRNPGNSIDTVHLSPGIYFVVLEDASGHLQVQKLLKN